MRRASTKHNLLIKRIGKYRYCDLQNKIIIEFMEAPAIEKKAKLIGAICEKRGYRFLPISFSEFNKNLDVVIDKINSLKDVAQPSSNLI